MWALGGDPTKSTWRNFGLKHNSHFKTGSVESSLNSINHFSINNLLLLLNCCIFLYYLSYIQGAFHNNFPGFTLRGDFMFSKFRNRFCACSSQPG